MSRSMTPWWGRRATLVLVMCAFAVPAAAQPDAKKPPAPEKPDAKSDKPGGKDEKKKPKDQVFNFEGLGLAGKNRSPQLLYFLERANEELERASLQKRSFIPHIVRSVEEEQL